MERSHWVAREEALSLMPTDASAVLFVDFGELRRAPFIAATLRLGAKTASRRRLCAICQRNRIRFMNVTSIGWPLPWRNEVKTQQCLPSWMEN